MNTKITGNKGEDRAAAFLESKGFSIKPFPANFAPHKIRASTKIRKTKVLNMQ
jgi:hypothetical protein